MSNADKISTVHKYMEAVSSDNLALIREIYADNATLEDPVGTQPHEGIEAICEFYKRIHGMGVKLELIGSVRCAGNSAAFPFTAQMGPIKLEIIDMFEFDEQGKVRSMRAYWSYENKV